MPYPSPVLAGELHGHRVVRDPVGAPQQVKLIPDLLLVLPIGRARQQAGSVLDHRCTVLLRGRLPWDDETEWFGHAV